MFAHAILNDLKPGPKKAISKLRLNLTYGKHLSTILKFAKMLPEKLPKNSAVQEN